jgi:hypothetical protein
MFFYIYLFLFTNICILARTIYDDTTDPAMERPGKRQLDAPSTCFFYYIYLFLFANICILARTIYNDTTDPAMERPGKRQLDGPSTCFFLLSTYLFLLTYLHLLG